jgi:hypothetical protein
MADAANSKGADLAEAFAGPNYSAHVIDAIPLMSKNFRRSGMAQDAETLRAWAGMIERSVKFVLPPAGVYFTQGKGLREGVYPQRMPFPLISLEVPYPESNYDFGGVKSSRRHIMCQEANMIQSGEGWAIDNTPKEPEGFFITIFSYVDRAKAWVPQACSAYVRYDTPTGSGDNATYPGEAWAKNGQSTMGFARVPVLAQMWDSVVLRGGSAEAEKAFIRDTAEEVRIAFEFLQVLACRNVRQSENPPSEKLNKARVRSGKKPIDKFYTLRIGDVLIGRPHDGHQFTGAFKVREHFRSGHIRRLDDRSVWVTDTIVAAGSAEGRVVKRYAVPYAYV